MDKPKKTLHYLALGDSYTIGEAVSPSESFPIVLTEVLQEKGYALADPTIVARTGWTTQELSSAMDQHTLLSDYDLVTLLIGVNNQYRGLSVQEYQKEFKQLVLSAIRLVGGNPKQVVVLSIPDYGYTPFGEAKQPTISFEIDSFNLVNQEIASCLGAHYVNITDMSREASKDVSLLAPDGLHLSGKMYRLWVERLSPKVEGILASD